MTELEARDLIVQCNKVAYGIMLRATYPNSFWKDIQDRYAHLNALLDSLV
jgi:hypothetical protein